MYRTVSNEVREQLRRDAVSAPQLASSFTRLLLLLPQLVRGYIYSFTGIMPEDISEDVSELQLTSL